MKRPPSKFVPRRTVKRMLVDQPWTLDHELSRLFMAKVYRNPSGSALLTFDGAPAVLYESRAELLAWHETRVEEARRGPMSLGELLTPSGHSFVDAIPELVRTLPGHLNVSPALLDKTLPSLAVVDDALKRIDPARILTAPVFSSLTAYVGEVIRLAVAGKWTARPVSGATAMPWIVSEGDFECCPALIYKEFLEYQKSASVLTYVEGILGARRLIQRTSAPTDDK